VVPPVLLPGLAVRARFALPTSAHLAPLRFLTGPGAEPQRGAMARGTGSGAGYVAPRPTECWVPEVAYLPVFTNWMQSPWFLNVGLVKVCQPSFMHWFLLVGRSKTLVWNSTAPISQIPMRANPS
jgi:hypothetical protein